MSCRFISRWQQNSKIWVTADFLSYWAMIIAQILLHDRMIGTSADHILLEVVTVYLWMLIQVSPLLTLRICFQVNHEKSILVVWMQPFDYDYLSWAWPWGPRWLSQDYDILLMMTILRVCILWVIVLGGRSPQRGFVEINHAALQILTWMSALPGAYCECADELRESHPLLSGPVVAPVFGEPCSWCPCAPLDFWLSEQTAAGKRKRQVVCKILGEAQGNWEVNIKKQ